MQHAEYKSFQRMSFVSTVNPDVKPAVYELKIEATNAKGTIEVKGSYPVA